MIESSLRPYLAADLGVSGYVADRIYPIQLPQAAALPAVTYQRISTVPYHHLEGYSGLTASRLQIDCWAVTYADAKGLAEAVRLALDGFSGAMGEHTIESVLLLGHNDVPESPDGDGEYGIQRVSMDFRVAFDEPIPAL